MSDAPLLLSVRDAAKILGVGRDHLYGLVRSNAIASVAVGRRKLIPRAALSRWVEAASGTEPTIEAEA